MANDLDFDSWCAAHGLYLNDDDDGARAARLMALSAWQAAAKAEREAILGIIERRTLLSDDLAELRGYACCKESVAAAIRGRG
jgi:hypothetical protein